MTSLGVSATATPNEALGALAVNFEAMKRRQDALQQRFRYTTQDESMIGKRIEGDNREKGQVYEIDFHIDEDVVDIPAALMSRCSNSTASSAEDSDVNEPFCKILRSVSPTSLHIKFTGQSCNLIDGEGREQRVDLSVFAADYQEWASLVTVLEGKVDLKTTNWERVLGQCMRRATAILEQQTWRKFVVIPFYCLSEIGFLRVEWDWTDKREYGCPLPTRSEKMQCLRVENDNVVVGDGFRALQAMLEEPSRFGYLPCPVEVDKADLDNLGLTSPSPICFRSQSKALFVVESAQDESTKYVVKVYRDRSIAEKEHASIEKLSDVTGAIKLQVGGIETVNCRWGDSEEEASAVHSGEDASAALVLRPYCRALTPSLASIDLFGQYARTLRDAVSQGLCNNDVSPDNLLVNVLDDGSKIGIVADWEIATPPGTEIMRHSGKLLFCPQVEEGVERIASLLGDLESLFYVAVSCAEDGVAWVYKRSDRTISDEFELRKRATGLGKRRDSPFKRWNDYLVRVREALVRAQESQRDVDVRGVVEAFGNVEA